MRIIIDSCIYKYQTFGGISRIFDNLIPRLCDLNDKLSIKMFINYLPTKSLPNHPQIEILDLWKKYRFNPLWRLSKRINSRYYNYILQKEMSYSRETVWFSTYYTIPSYYWKGYQIVLVHDLIYEMFPDLLPESKKIIDQKKESILNANVIICNSYTTAKDLQYYYNIPESKVFVAHLGFDDVFKVKTPQLINHKIDFPYFLYIGQRGYYKGFDTLLNSFSAWSGNDKTKLVVVGPPWTVEEQELLKSKKLSEKVFIFANINDSQLCDIYNQAKAIIYPSLYEGFGIPLLEAMACGCPIIASKIPSTIEIAKQIPFYFKPGDDQELIVAMENVINNLTINERITKGLNWVNQFSWDKMAKQVYEIIRNNLSERMN